MARRGTDPKDPKDVQAAEWDRRNLSEDRRRETAAERRQRERDALAAVLRLRS